jgi:DNA repair exonuclease SbcCD ATPase subunit
MPGRPWRKAGRRTSYGDWLALRRENCSVLNSSAVPSVIQGVSSKSERSLQKADAIRFKLQELQLEWHALRQKLEKSEAESKETRDLIISEAGAAIQSLGKKVAESEERLKATNKASLSEQAELLKRLDSSTHANADLVNKSKTLIIERAERLQQLLGSLREELQNETRTKLLHAEELLESQFKDAERALDEKHNSLRSGMTRSLTEHQQSIDRQLTDFLNKQNALVQNLTQQIDSYQRASQAQAAELAATKSKLNELSSAFAENKITATQELTAMVNETSALKSVLAEVQRSLASQGQALTTLEHSSQDTAARLGETLEKLKKSFFVGGKFK